MAGEGLASTPKHTWQSGFKKQEVGSGGSGPAAQPPKCPECASTRVWKDGLRHNGNGPVQRWLCRECGFRFSDPSSRPSKISADFEPLDRIDTQILFTSSSLIPNRRVCVSEAGAKNLATEEPQTEKAGAGATQKSSETETDAKGQIVKFLWELKKQGLKDSTIRTYRIFLSILIRAGADLRDPETVKDVLAKRKWSEQTKSLTINVYDKFLQVHGGSWTPPKCHVVRKLPFIPQESEIDQLISGANRKLACFLQVLKETGMRCGEAWKLKWDNVDLENTTITLNDPEKYGKPRMFKVSSRLISMLNLMPKNGMDVFNGNYDVFKKTFRKHRRRTAFKLQNLRLNRITLHTFRHWKATMEYHRTKDILHVKELLGHRNIDNTMIYTQLVTFEGDDYHTAVAKTLEEDQELIKAGFDYVTERDGVKIYRKRK